MEYTQAIDYLFNALPAFERNGAADYKPGLDRSLQLAALFGNPQHKLRTIHIAGTNGKGSTAHTLAAMLQHAGYRTGLYTSPHLVDFRERIRINGAMIPHERVCSFVDRFVATRKADSIAPSFFELTTIMALEYFADEQVDIAVIETGLGGRLDTTNIITPLLSVITNISLDHTALLGDTLPAIAAEKAGIIKAGVPAVIGEAGDREVREVFEHRAAEMAAPIYFAEDVSPIAEWKIDGDRMVYRLRDGRVIYGALTGECQHLNAATILTAVEALRLHHPRLRLSDDDVAAGFRDVVAATGLQGRWATIGENPRTIADTGHNPAGWRSITAQLAALPANKRMVIGFVADKDVDSMLAMMPRDAIYYFTQADSHRALPASELRRMASKYGLQGDIYPDVHEAVEAARDAGSPDDVVFVGGSNYLLANLLERMK